MVTARSSSFLLYLRIISMLESRYVMIDDDDHDNRCSAFSQPAAMTSFSASSSRTNHGLSIQDVTIWHGDLPLIGDDDHQAWGLVDWVEKRVCEADSPAYGVNNS
ncbi:unnamed protein product [Heligmosomoides polygyrus]|uniref:Secreted protein n=1 Tax=Heligmosomoides polygyrus TaxID=6339 RepID=A0A183FNT6_HELPZ|nr:unnamed protein product [Heligmosomoides polygyrus]